jgi:hypothetical protein
VQSHVTGTLPSTRSTNGSLPEADGIGQGAAHRDLPGSNSGLAGTGLSGAAEIGEPRCLATPYSLGSKGLGPGSSGCTSACEAWRAPTSSYQELPALYLFFTPQLLTRPR